MKTGDSDAIGAILAPGYTSTDMRGDTRTADDMIAMAQRMAAFGGDRTSQTTVQSATIDGDAAEVEQTSDTTMHREGRDGQEQSFEIHAVSADHWIDKGGTWLLQTSTTKAMTFKRDGVAITPRRRGG